MHGNGRLEEADFDAEELLGVLAEVADKETKIAGEAGKVVVEFGIGEEFASSGSVVVELGSGVGEVGAGVAESVVERVVGGEFAKSAPSSADITDEGVGIGDSFFGLIVE